MSCSIRRASRARHKLQVTSKCCASAYICANELTCLRDSSTTPPCSPLAAYKLSIAEICCSAVVSTAVHDAVAVSRADHYYQQLYTNGSAVAAVRCICLSTHDGESLEAVAGSVYTIKKTCDLAERM